MKKTSTNEPESPKVEDGLGLAGLLVSRMTWGLGWFMVWNGVADGLGWFGV